MDGLVTGLWCAFAVASAPVELPPVEARAPQEAEAPESLSDQHPTGSLSVVEAAEERGYAREAAELVARVPGATVRDAGGFGQSKTLSVRGASPSSVLVMLDGVPLGGTGGSVDLASLPLAVAERLELLRGAAGARHGMGGLGGAVNLVTRPASDGLRMGAEVMAGSFDTQTVSVHGAGPVLSGETLLLLHFGRSAGDFPFLFDPQQGLQTSAVSLQRRENNAARSYGALLKYGHRLGAHARIDAVAQAAALERGLAGTAQNPTPDQREHGDRAVLSVRASSRIEDRGELFARGRFRREAVALSGVPFSGAENQVQTEGGVDVGAHLAFGEHGVAARAELSSEALHLASRPGPGWLKASLGLSDEWWLGSLLLSPSLRFDRVGPFGGISPAMGAAYQLPAGFEIRANVGQSFRAPSFIELYVVLGHLLPNPKLRPERGLFADAAVVYRQGATSLGLTAFRTTYEDLISYEYYPPLLARAYNFSTASAQGLELEARAAPRLFDAVVSYTLLFTQNLRDEPRSYLKELPYRPRHQILARLTAGPEALRARAQASLQSSQYINRFATVALPPRAFVDVGVTTRLSRAPDLSVTAEVKNLTNTAGQDLDGYPLPGRAFFITLAFELARHQPPETEVP